MVNKTCSHESLAHATEPVVGSWDFQKLMVVIGAICAIITISICLSLIVLHLMNRRVVQEQKLIIRILMLPLTWSIFAVAGVGNYSDALYLDPIPQLQEAIAVAALFELIVTYIVPRRDQRQDYFSHVDHLDKKHHKIDDAGSWRWFQGFYPRVYQFPVIFIIVTIVNEGLAAADCPDNTLYQIINTLVQVVAGTSTAICVLAIIAFARRFKTELKPYGVMWKIIALKGIVGLTTTQKFIIGIVNRFHDIKATSKASYADYVYGLPDFIITIEMLMAAIAFAFTFNHLPYTASRMRKSMRPTSATETKTNPIMFLLEGIYFPDLFLNIWETLKTVRELQTTRGSRKDQQRGRQQWSNEPYARLVDSHSPARNNETSDERYEMQPPPQYSDQPGDSSFGYPQTSHPPQLLQTSQNDTSYQAPNLAVPQHTQAPLHLNNSSDSDVYHMKHEEPEAPF